MAPKKAIPMHGRAGKRKRASGGSTASHAQDLLSTTAEDVERKKHKKNPFGYLEFCLSTFDEVGAVSISTQTHANAYWLRFPSIARFASYLENSGRGRSSVPPSHSFRVLIPHFCSIGKASSLNPRTDAAGTCRHGLRLPTSKEA